MLRKLWIIAFVLTVSTWGTARAEIGRINVGINPGVSIPLNSDLDNFNSSFHLGAHGLYYLSNSVAVGAEMGYSFQHKLNNDILGASENAKLKMFYITPEMKVDGLIPMANRAVNTYLIGGFGLYSTRTSADVSFPGVPTQSASTTNNDTGFNVGVGIEYAVNDVFRLGGDFRYHQIFNPGQDSKFFIPSVMLSILY